jgi:allophanate hydrolase
LAFVKAPTIDVLRKAYLSGERTPTDEVQRFWAHADEPRWATAWILRREREALQERARDLESHARAEPDFIRTHPLYGVLYAVKDNIDVAGLPTTAACPAFAYTPTRSAAAVDRLEQAGAILVGKTNLDQFATGLVGTRSPYGAVPNAVDPAFISGGSSSGSAVAVARGWVTFALGTDTAGSGRVPAGLNGIVGLKPSRGLVSARGVVPACRSLDCVSVFSASVDDAVAVLEVLRGHDASDPWSRTLELAPDLMRDRFRFGVPQPLELFGDEVGRGAFEATVATLERIGGERVDVDFGPFRETAALLYEGPWIAERLSGIRAFFDAHADAVHEVVRTLIQNGARYDAAQVFEAWTRRETLRSQVEPVWNDIDALVVPTAPTAYRIAEVLAEPFETNRRLGFYHNFVNLLDLAAVAVPGTPRADGLPAGVTVIHRAGSDLMLADLGRRLMSAMSASPSGRVAPFRGDTVDVAVVGAHLSGQPLNRELLSRDARLLRTCRTAPSYHLYLLAGTTPSKPGLVRGESGHAIEVEVWRVPASAYGSFVAGIPSPLGVGRVQLEDGTSASGFLCESWAVRDVQEISSFGGWRAWLARAEGSKLP